ncbi:MAG: HNH endonuclease [Bacilli bacterium]|nr:HNH endonuclease [Bacilli bacterium]MDD4734266.1 HNH endonuclease [Bacilli bacterium]
MQKKKVIINELEKIIEYLDGKSESIINLIKSDPSCSYTLFQKYISHSDLISSGKRAGKEQSVDRNYLYYLSNEKMFEMEQETEMESAKQSNIGVPEEFYKVLGIPKLERRIGAQTTQHEHPEINHYADVYLVNDTMKYFTIDYTKKVFEKLGKEVNWDFDKFVVDFTDNDFTPIKISCAIHGIGIESDTEFHKLRRNIFKTDSFICLVKENLDTRKKELYILLEKNPIFFTIIGESNKAWENYLSLKNIKDLQKLTMEDNLSKEDVEKSRSLQGKWKDMLAAEMMNYTATENEVFCPFTYITSDYSSLKTLYRASHIKEFANCDPNEAYDINNGLLLCANADALFDKHLITIDENKNIIFSFLLEHNAKLKSELKLNNGIFTTVLNDDRMKYIEVHRDIFMQKEVLRKLGQLDDKLDENDEDDYNS